VTVFLVRHASAGTRNGSDPGDVARRLDANGHKQTSMLIELLNDAPVQWVASSPAIRCVETVEPLASGRGLVLEQRRELFEGADIDAAWSLLESAAERDGDSVLCSHGDVIPELVRRAQLRGMEVPEKTGCSKGSCWALEWDGARFTTSRYTPLKP
jgi:phosphohistidine phosphatase SixA